MTAAQRTWHLVHEALNLPLTLAFALVALPIVIWRDFLYIDRDEFGPGERYSASVIYLEKPLTPGLWSLTIGNLVLINAVPLDEPEPLPDYRAEIMGWEQWPVIWPLVRVLRSVSERGGVDLWKALRRL